MILESSVEQGKVCCCGGLWLGVTAWNGILCGMVQRLSSSYNNSIRHHSGKIHPVAPSPVERRVGTDYFLN